MAHITSIRDLVNLWPTRAELAADLKRLIDEHRVEGVDVTTAQVHKWAEKGSIPPKYHWLVLTAASRRGMDVTADRLVLLHAGVPRSDSAPRQPEGDAA